LQSKPGLGKTAEKNNEYWGYDMLHQSPTEPTLRLPRLVSEEAKKIGANLKYMTWGIEREYSKCVQDLMITADAAEDKNLNTTKLMYVELLEDVNSLGEDKAYVVDAMAAILRELIKIYQEQRNLPAVKHM